MSSKSATHLTLHQPSLSPVFSPDIAQMLSKMTSPPAARGPPVSSPTLTQTTPPRDLSNWYLGLHSGTQCIATSQATDVRVVKDGLPVPVHLRSPSGTHPICKVWETTVTSSIIPIADRLGVPFTCIVLICIARPSGEVSETEKEDGEECWPPIIWVAVEPGWSDISPSGRFVEEVMEVLRPLDLGEFHVEVHTG